MPDGEHLIKYQDHGIKILISTPIVANRASCVAYALMKISRLLDLPQFYSPIMEDNSAACPDIHLTVTVPLIISFLMMSSATSNIFDLKYKWLEVPHVALIQTVALSA